MPAATQTLSDSAFMALRSVLLVVALSVVFLTIRLAILWFVGQRSRRLGRKKYALAAGNVFVLFLLTLLLKPIAGSLSNLGNWIGNLVPALSPVWLSTALVGLFYALVSWVLLMLLIQIVGALFWLFDARLAYRFAGAGATGARVYIHKALVFVNRFLRTAVLSLLIMAYLVEFHRFFPVTGAIVDQFIEKLGTPARDIGQAILNYLPHVIYLAIIGIIGWLCLRLVRHTFRSIGDGTLTIRGFSPEWASPTYKLVRTIILLFLLMVSYPYLPGANSQFFQGFSVFVGALVTFGSTGAISHIVSGITLTYTNSFRLGDFVRIGETTGFVREKSLLVTRLVTKQNESVTIPNGTILSSSILNYTALAATERLALTVDAGIGYDVDWRTVQRLMIDGARQTEHILSDPPPCVWQTNLGDYAVSYQLRAWTDRADLLLETHSALRAHVLDEFNRAGVEIMTPSIFAHRDASGLAIPQEQLPDRPTPRGIAVELKGVSPNAPVHTRSGLADS